MNKHEFVMQHRWVTFCDEWLCYVALTSLYALHRHAGWPIWPFGTALVWAIFTIAVSYVRQWRMEANLNGYRDED